VKAVIAAATAGSAAPVVVGLEDGSCRCRGVRKRIGQRAGDAIGGERRVRCGNRMGFGATRHEKPTMRVCAPLPARPARRDR